MIVTVPIPTHSIVPRSSASRLHLSFTSLPSDSASLTQPFNQEKVRAKKKECYEDRFSVLVANERVKRIYVSVTPPAPPQLVSCTR